MNDLTSRMSTLTPEQRRLLEKRIKGRELEPVVPSKRATEIIKGKQEGARTDGDRAFLTEQEAALRPMEFSIFFFADDASSDANNRYHLLMECAKYADTQGFTAVWTPERHFHAFGGLYPNPAVLGAALSMATKNLEIRAGSVVLPLHNPIRVVEDWSVVDNLSNGRVGIALASGWHPDDFALIPENYPDRKKVMYRHLETIKKLWAGESLNIQGGGGNEISIKTFPRPVRRELPIWLSSSGNIETFIKAGENGLNILTSLINQTPEELGDKIRVYRKTLEENGFDPDSRKVSLMIHTFIGTDFEFVNQKVKQPIFNYLRTNLDLHVSMARGRSIQIDVDRFTRQDEDSILSFAFERYINHSSLLGTLEACEKMVTRLKCIGINECACLLDFGLDVDSVLKSLELVSELRRICNR